MLPNLLKSRRLLPLLVTQFLGAFNDNLFKNALFTVVTFKIATNAELLTHILSALFILPFFLFSATAGEIADKYDRARLTRYLKITEIVLMCGVGLAYWLNSLPLLVVILFLMGTQSSFFGPIKYALLPQQLKQNELIAGNAYVEGSTYLAIMGGLILGTILPLTVSIWLLIMFSVLGFLSARFILPAPAPRPEMHVSYHIFKTTLSTFSLIKQNKTIWKSILGATWFWSLGAFIVVQVYVLSDIVFHVQETVVTFFLLLFSIGVAIGSVTCNKILKGMLHVTYVPLSAIGMTCCFLMLYFLTRSYPTYVEPASLMVFLSDTKNILISLCLFLMAFCGGLYVVPLQALIQDKAPKKCTASVIAGNNIVNSLGMVIIAIFSAGLLALGVTIPQLFLIVALIGFGVSFYICSLLPDAFVRSVLYTILKLLFKIEINGLSHYKKAGKRVLLVANHTSLLDALLLVACIPEKLTFAINTEWSKKWFIRMLRPLVDLYALDPTNPMAIRSLIEEIKKDKKVIIFPEGRITVTGGLMKVYEGAGIVAEKAQARILPIRIDGAQYSKFSYLKHKIKTRLFPTIHLNILPPEKMTIPDTIIGRQRRTVISNKLYDLMVRMMYATSQIDENLFCSLLEASSVYGSKHVILEDVTRKPLTYRQLLFKSYVLGSVYHHFIPHEKYVGLMLPNMNITVLSLFALMRLDKVPTMINFTQGIPQILSTLKTVGVKTVITSRLFVRQAHLENLTKAVLEQGVRIIYAEDLLKQSFWKQKIQGMFDFICRKRPQNKPNDAAVVLFTSGSEGLPKAVVLSHRNFQANRYQISSVMAFNASDVFFNALPMFHSFGLSVGCMMTLLSGVKTFLYPSPLHYRIVPELVYDTNATIICSTDTFLAGYGRLAHPYDFFSIKYAIVGGEKLKEKTAQLWSKKFGVRVLEGYGATETSPVLSINTPMYLKEGSVGRLLTGMQYRLEKIEGIEDGGELWVTGDNVMLGYMKADKPEILQPPQNNWYNTGDIVTVDDNGFITIQGRAKRFAKIAGEMVSLSSVEGLLSQQYPDTMHGVLAVSDEKKGEQLVCLTNNPQMNVEAVQTYFKQHQFSELWVPRKIIYMKDLPLLGTGKFDYQKAKELLKEITG